MRDITYGTFDGRRAAVLFVHWYGPPGPTSNRTQFIPDAIELAKSGVVSLLIAHAVVHS